MAFSPSSFMADEETLIQRYSTLILKRFLGALLLEEGRTDVKVADLPTFVIELRKLLRDAESASVLVSPNEDIESASTSSILFCMIEFAIGSVLYHHMPFDRDNRHSVLRSVRSHWESFLRSCSQLGVLKATGRDPHTREYKRESLHRQQSLKGSILKVMQSSDFDESRQDVVNTLEYFGISCQNDLGFVEKELLILSVDRSDSGSVPTETDNRCSPWTLKLDQTNIKAFLASQVFKPDITMPSMSLREFAALECKRLEAQSSSIGSPPSVDDEGYYRSLRRADEAAERKARRWDDWKDDNPRGFGNKLGNIG